MKKYILLALLIPFNFFSQSISNEDEFKFDEHFGKRVFLNKTVTSYNFSTITYKNAKKVKSKNYVNFDNPVPSKIYINSDENKAIIRINSKYFKEDLFYEFKRIYKITNDDGSWFYTFKGKSSCDVSYYVPKNGDNQFLLIKCLDENKDGPGLDYTMSRLEQL